MQIDNILKITELFDYVEETFIQTEKPILVDLLFCNDPIYLDVSILPKRIKDLAISRINDFKERSVFYNNQNIQYSNFIKNGTDSLLNLLNKNDIVDSNILLNDFVYYTKTLDKIRNQSINQYIPELYDMMKQEGYF
jgi:hypothetical protein